MDAIPKTADPFDTTSQLYPIKPSIYFPRSALFPTADHPTIQNARMVRSIKEEGGKA